MDIIMKKYDVVVIGGGIAGMCAAISSARHGANTALVQNRPVLGGNASGEIRMHICGADKHSSKKNARETGIVEELQIRNKARNPEYSYPIFDNVLWECAAFEERLDLYLNLHIDEVICENNTILSVSGTQQTTEKRFRFISPLFVDATGDGSIGEKAGAMYMYGREDKAMFGEPDGQERADECTMGNSIMFRAYDTGHPVKYTKPEWAYTYTEEDLKNRAHGRITSGYWWIELGGNNEHTIYDAETLRDELYKTVYGMWDHIKNGGDHGAENYELEWVGALPGKRESRRLVGDYVLSENDILENRQFDDAVAYGGWDMDCHVIDGFRTKNDQPTKYIGFEHLYQIPYRCLYSKNIDNLFISGRAFSLSHLAFASARVMGTCGVAGQAVGTAAAIAHKYNILPRGVCEHIDELKQTLLKDDCFIPNVSNHDDDDLARTCRVSASSKTPEHSAENVINGVSRPVGEDDNCWESGANNDEYITLTLPAAAKVNEIRIAFDSDLNTQLTMSIDDWVRSSEHKTLPPTLVKDYDVIFSKGGSEVCRETRRNNIMRHNIVKTGGVVCDEITIKPLSTYGAEKIRIFEIRIY